MRRFARFCATLGPIGSSPVAPATGGSFVTALIGWFIPPPGLAITACAIVAGIAFAVWAAGEAERDLGHDAKPIVIDEVMGQTLALLFAPHAPLVFFAAFVLFRIFDVWKPLGAHQAQRLPGGFGVVADDLIAGLTSCAALQLLLRWPFAAHALGAA